MAYLACAITLRGDRFDVIFCDLVPHAMPLLRLFSRARLVFYCHFPDQLLTPQRRFLYRLYRAPIDRLEEITTGMADRVLVNSHFTAAAFRQTFLRLRTVTPEVLYPGIDVARYARLDAEHSRTPDNTTPAGTGKTTLLSISRYERQKNVALAIQALALLRARLSPEAFARLQLVVAGGYDKRLREHRETLRDLQLRVHRLRLGAHVVFVRSPTDTARLALLSRCLCVVYTPENEHFGLVPLEAMAAGRPVVAVRSGGPLETVRHEATGLLCAPTPEAFAEALARLITNPAEARRLGQEGRAHVLQHFSHSAFGNRLDTMMRNLVEPPQ
jgi:alpha-1,3/alpha-1,6-mannosyltransferase